MTLIEGLQFGNDGCLVLNKVCTFVYLLLDPRNLAKQISKIIHFNRLEHVLVCACHYYCLLQFIARKINLSFEYNHCIPIFYHLNTNKLSVTAEARVCQLSLLFFVNTSQMIRVHLLFTTTILTQTAATFIFLIIILLFK